MHTEKLLAALTIAPPSIAAAEAERIARLEFGIQSTAESLPSERDQNFRLRTVDGAQFVLRVANHIDGPGAIDLQARALLHIEKKAPNLPVPRIVKTRAGALHVPLSDADGHCHTAWVVSYREGSSLRSVQMTCAVRQAIGSSLAQLDLALHDYFHSSASREHPWDLRQIECLRELLIHIHGAERRGLAEQFLQRFDHHAAEPLKQLRSQVIHNDFNLSNLLVIPDRSDNLVGILDFGDMIYAPLINDIAVAAAYHVSGEVDPLRGAAELVAAYHAVLPLEPDELELLFDLIGARLAATVIITEWRARRYPENADFILKNNSSSWSALEAMRSLFHQDGARCFIDACYSASKPVMQSSTLRANRAPAVELLARRARLLGPAYRLFYEYPVHLVRGEGVWLYDGAGRAYLDAYNNVPHVGHCHPRVIAALTAQANTLNTHTRYLHEAVLEYAEKLGSRFPELLRTFMFTCTGSEANELAVRIARAATGNRGIIATQNAYHGNTTTIAEFSSSYPSAENRGPHVRTVAVPDCYRKPELHTNRDLVSSYVQQVQAAIDSLGAEGIGLAAFIADTVFSSDGILTVPDEYLARVVEIVRAAGGVFIADEVQAGFGRMGLTFWGFEQHGVVPDLVTLGKPMGNGHPVAAVVMRSELAEAFGARTRYFNTFGGNPVSCAVGLAVLAVLDEENLQARAADVGEYLRTGLNELASRYACIGDVRGHGLYVGVEFVRDRTTLEAATSEVSQIVNALRDRGVLTATTGAQNNVLKIRPPMVFSRNNADQLIDTLNASLKEL